MARPSRSIRSLISEDIQPVGLGAGAPLPHLVLHDRVRDRRRVLLSEPRPRGRSELHHQDDGHQRQVARRIRRGSHQAGHRQDREEAAGTGIAGLYQKRDSCRKDHRFRRASADHQGARRRGNLGAGAQHDRRYPGHFSERRPGSILQRSLRRRLRQHLCLHQRWADAAPAARSGRGCALEDPHRGKCREGRRHRRTGRGHLSRILHPPDRGAGDR